MNPFLLFLVAAILFGSPSVLFGKELPKMAVWDLAAREVKATYAQELTSILVSEVAKLKKYEVYSQEDVRTLAGWTAERMKLGCTDSQCLTALGQMDVSKLVSGSVGKIGNRYSVSLKIFDTQNARAENSVSEFCRSEDELIELVQVAVRKLLGEEMVYSVPSAQEKGVPPPPPPATVPSQPQTPLTQPVIPTGTLKDSLTGMEFVYIRGGCFEMGDTFGGGYQNEKPVHEVCVDDFYLGKYEVTQAQWEKVMGNNPSRFKGRDNPVEQASWNDVQQFIERLNNQSERKYRLPTEAEWEYGARSGGKKEKYSGTSQEGVLGQYAWYGNNSGNQTHPVGEKRPNGLGLYDMAGNVWEWCADWYDGNYYKNSPKNNPVGPGNGQVRVLRSGSWVDDPRDVRAAFRTGGLPADRGNYSGFRLAAPAR
jgi:formylglycine-generating enzyme required for sulfatase activity